MSDPVASTPSEGPDEEAAGDVEVAVEPDAVADPDSVLADEDASATEPGEVDEAPAQPGEDDVVVADAVASDAATDDLVVDAAADHEAEARAHLEDLQRVTAEFANYRRQAEKRNAEAADRAAVRLVDVLLPVLDACDKAVEHGSDDVEPIRTLLMQSLEREGLERVDPVGEPFDPQLHEAVMQIPADDEADDDAVPIVAEVMRAGFTFNGVVVRAAMVTVKG